MTNHPLSRREFIATTGKAAVAAAVCGGLCGEACGATGQPSGTGPGAVCGIYCGACPAYLASVAAKKAADVKCLGCGSTRKPPPYAPKCEVRHCARSRALKSCGLCKDYPCAKIKAFFNDKPKYGLREKYLNAVRDQGYGAWLAAMKTRWTCPTCQTPFGYGMKTCGQCGGKIVTDAEEFAAFKA